MALAVVGALFLPTILAPTEQTPRETEASPAPREVPLVVPVVGGIVGWNIAPSTSVAGVWPIEGEASGGRKSIIVRAPVLIEESAIAATDIATHSDGTLSFSLKVRSLDESQPLGLAVQVGDERVELSLKAGGAWQSATAEFAEVADADATQLQLIVTSPNHGFLVDEVRLTEDGSDEPLLMNGSFEEVSLGQGVTNRSLILTSSTAGIAYNGTSSLANWTVVDPVSGATIASGEINAAEPSVADLREIPPGYYRADLVDRDGASTSTEFALVDIDDLVIEPASRLGVTTHVERDYYAQAAGLAASLGAGLIRNDVLWNLNEATVGQYNFDSRYTTIFGEAKANGIGLVAIAGYGHPEFDSWRTPSNTESVAAYGRYAGAIAREFQPVAIEVWNEFNHEPFNNGACGLSPECYQPLLGAASNEIRAASPDTEVIAGVTALYDSPWFQSLWAAGGGDLADAMSFHPYEVYSNPDSLAGVVGQAQADFRANSAGSDKPIWITELGWTTKAGDVSREEQASRLIRSAVVAFAAGVERYVWYDLINDDPDPASHEGNFGLFSQPAAGATTLTPKPAAYAFALLSARIGELAVSNASVSPEGVQIVEFGDGDRRVRVVWAPAPVNGVSIDISGEQAVLESALGGSTTQSSVDGAIVVDVTTTPLIITESAAD